MAFSLAHQALASAFFHLYRLRFHTFMLLLRCVATVAAGLNRPAATAAKNIPTTPPTTPHRMPGVMFRSPAIMIVNTVILTLKLSLLAAALVVAVLCVEKMLFNMLLKISRLILSSLLNASL